MNDKVYTHLKNRYNEVYSLKPNTLHVERLDILFKSTTKRLKTFPFKVFIPVALIVAFALYVVLGGLIINLASILQYGFWAFGFIYSCSAAFRETYFCAICNDEADLSIMGFEPSYYYLGLCIPVFYIWITRSIWQPLPRRNFSNFRDFHVVLCSDIYVGCDLLCSCWRAVY